MFDLSFPAINEIISASVSSLSILLVITFQVISSKRLPMGRMGSTGPIPVPIRLARLLLQVALPVYLVAIVFWTVTRSIRAALEAHARPPAGRDPVTTTVYLAMTGKFLMTVANIGTGLALWYAAITIALFYRNANRDRESAIARARVRVASQNLAAAADEPKTAPTNNPPTITKKRFLLIHIVPGAAVAFCLLALEALYFGRQVDNVTRSREASKQRQTSPGLPSSYRQPSTQALHWPLLVIDIILLLSAVACLLDLTYWHAMSIVAVPTTKKALNRIIGSSVFWLLRSSYRLYPAIKNFQGSWTEKETEQHLVLYPILEYFAGAWAMGLLVLGVRDGVWKGCVVHSFPDPSSEKMEGSLGAAAVPAGIPGKQPNDVSYIQPVVGGQC